MDKGSKVFVAGHGGLVGSAIVDGERRRGILTSCCGCGGSDLTDQRAVAEFFAKEKPEFVFLAAAKVGLPLANEAYPADFIRENLLIEKNIIESSRAELDTQIGDLLPHWSIAPIVTALQALRGVASVIAIALVAEIGNFRRFPSARDLMAYFGLVPGEHPIGCTVRSRGITKQGNSATRALLYEAAWCYRQSAKIAQWMKARMPIDGPQFARDIAWKAQTRPCGRYRKLIARGKKVRSQSLRSHEDCLVLYGQ